MHARRSSVAASKSTWRGDIGFRRAPADDYLFCRRRCQRSFDGGLPHEAFLNWCVDQLTSLGDVEDVIPCSHEERGRAVHGFAYSDHDARLDLFITSYQRAQSSYTLRKDVYEPLVKRLENFFFRYYGNTTNDLEVSSPAYDLVEHIQRVDISLLRLYVLTDGEATVTRTEDRVENGLAIQTHIWDCKRFCGTCRPLQSMKTWRLWYPISGSTVFHARRL